MASMIRFRKGGEMWVLELCGGILLERGGVKVKLRGREGGRYR